MAPQLPHASSSTSGGDSSPPTGYSSDQPLAGPSSWPPTRVPSKRGATVDQGKCNHCRGKNQSCDPKDERESMRWAWLGGAGSRTERNLCVRCRKIFKTDSEQAASEGRPPPNINDYCNWSKTQDRVYKKLKQSPSDASPPLNTSPPSGALPASNVSPPIGQGSQPTQGLRITGVPPPIPDIQVPPPGFQAIPAPPRSTTQWGNPSLPLQEIYTVDPRLLDAPAHDPSQFGNYARDHNRSLDVIRVPQPNDRQSLAPLVTPTPFDDYRKEDYDYRPMYDGAGNYRDPGSYANSLEPSSASSYNSLPFGTSHVHPSEWHSPADPPMPYHGEAADIPVVAASSSTYQPAVQESMMAGVGIPVQSPDILPDINPMQFDTMQLDELLDSLPEQSQPDPATKPHQPLTPAHSRDISLDQAIKDAGVRPIEPVAPATATPAMPDTPLSPLSPTSLNRRRMGEKPLRSQSWSSASSQVVVKVAVTKRGKTIASPGGSTLSLVPRLILDKVAERLTIEGGDGESPTVCLGFKSFPDIGPDTIDWPIFGQQVQLWAETLRLHIGVFLFGRPSTGQHTLVIYTTSCTEIPRKEAEIIFSKIGDRLKCCEVVPQPQPQPQERMIRAWTVAGTGHQDAVNLATGRIREAVHAWRLERRFL